MQNLFNALPLLACPLGMGLMMWMMMRGKKETPLQRMQGQAGDVVASQPSTTSNRLTTLHAQLDDVQEQIARLEAEDRTPASLSGAPLAPASSGRGTSGIGGR